MLLCVPKVVLENAAWRQSFSWGLLCCWARHCGVASRHNLRVHANSEDEQCGRGQAPPKTAVVCVDTDDVTVSYTQKVRGTSGKDWCVRASERVCLTCSCTGPVVFFSRLTACEWLMPSADVPQMLTMRSPICKGSQTVYTRGEPRYCWKQASQTTLGFFSQRDISSLYGDCRARKADLACQSFEFRLVMVCPYLAFDWLTLI